MNPEEPQSTQDLIAELDARLEESQARSAEFKAWMAEAAKRQEQFLQELTEKADRSEALSAIRRDRFDVIEERLTVLEHWFWLSLTVSAGLFFSGLILWAGWLN